MKTMEEKKQEFEWEKELEILKQTNKEKTVEIQLKQEEELHKMKVQRLELLERIALKQRFHLSVWQ